MNYGKRLKLVFDREVSHVSNAEVTSFALRNLYDEDIYPVALSYGVTKNIVYIDFEDFNSIVELATFECLGCIATGSPDLPFEAFSFPIQLYNLYPVPCDFEFLELASITIEGEIVELSYGELFEYEYLQLSDIAVAGDYIEVDFVQRYSTEYLEVATISIAGQYCDINGTPL